MHIFCFVAGLEHSTSPVSHVGQIEAVPLSLSHISNSGNSAEIGILSRKMSLAGDFSGTAILSRKPAAHGRAYPDRLSLA